MVALVDDGVWEREMLLDVIFYQVWQFAEGAPGVMTERVLGTLLEQWPQDADVLFYLAELYHRRGDLEQADATYLQVLDVEPEYAPAYLRLGMVAEASCERQIASCEELEKAAGWYERHYELAPDDLLGLKRLTEMCAAMEEAGVKDDKA